MQENTATCIGGQAETATVSFRIRIVGTNYELNEEPIVVDVPVLPMKVVVKSEDYHRTIDEVAVSF